MRLLSFLSRGAAVALGVFVGLHAGHAARRRLTSDSEPLPPECISGTLFRRLEESTEGPVIGGLLFSHGTLSKTKQRGYFARCEETDVALLRPESCVLIAETNSKALPFHVLRYERDGESWRLKPRVDLELPTAQDMKVARATIAGYLAKFAQLTAKLRPVVQRLAQDKKTGERGKLSRARRAGDGRVTVSVVRESADIPRVCGNRLVFVPTQTLEAEARAAGLDVVRVDAPGDWIVLASVYAVHSLGYDVLFVDPRAQRRWPPSALGMRGDGLFLRHHQSSDPDLAPYFASSRAFLLRCNWRTESLLDWLLFQMDLVASAGLDAVLNQLLAEANSQLGMTVAVLDLEREEVDDCREEQG